MRKLSFLFLLLVACQQRNSETTQSNEQSTELITEPISIEPFQLLIDSTFLLQPPNGTIVDINSPNYATMENEPIFEFVKTKAIYHVIDSLNLNDSIKAKFIFCNFDHLVLDGTLNLAFMGTFNEKNEQVDLLRIGKIEGASDYLATEFAEVNNFEIRKRINFLGVERDTTWTENYEIQPNGEIIEQAR